MSEASTHGAVGLRDRSEFRTTIVDSSESHPVIVKTSEIAVVASPTIVQDAFCRVLRMAGWSCSGLDLRTEVRPVSAIVILAEGSNEVLNRVADVRQKYPNTPIIVIGNDTTDRMAVVAAGATALPKDADFSIVVRSLALLTGNTVASRHGLTARHVEIMQLVAEGATTEEVADRLDIAAKTVNNHLSAVYRRLKTRNLTQAVLHAARAGLIDLTRVQ